ncbi:MAG: aminotransferase class I/II-fold pyridoxal phosphate-dependent enzyme [Verrucomicrobia bacterium]|nr:aminotransferase class I/II-fold pyridoxal phosphate-dependent enzyme [Verrucomicrobiota bacterium]
MSDPMTSATVAINSMAAFKKEQGETVYNFAAGDPIVPSHPKVIEAVSAALASEMVLYAPVAGLSELREAAAEWMNEEYGCSYTKENTLVAAGGKFALYAAMQILLKEGDEVLIPAPYWVSYPQIARLFKAEAVILPTEAENEWKLTPATLKKHITARSKILILNNPGNPTGNLYSKEDLEAILKAAQEAGVFVISDEVYSGIVYDDKRFFSCGALSDQVLVVQSCSKNFAMTGWRIGFAFGPTSLIRSMAALQSQSTTGASIVSQWAAAAALKNHSEITNSVRSTMQQRRDLFVDTLNHLFECNLEKPAAGLYAFIPLSIFNKSMSSSELCTELMTKGNIACVPGISFGQEGYLRMAFSEKEEVLREGLLALREAVIK